MALTPGTRLGPYAITAQIGVGGILIERMKASDGSVKINVPPGGKGH